MPHRHKHTAWMLKRDLEWALAAVVFAWGVCLLVPGETFALSQSYRILAATASELWWGGAAAFCGLAWLIALWVNGNYRRTPWLRMGFSVFGGVFFASIAQSFYAAAPGQLSTGVTTYAVLGAGCVVTAFRAAVDARGVADSDRIPV